MFRFDQLIRSGMTVREVKQRYPLTVPLFEHFGFRLDCDDCDIGTAPRRNGLNLANVSEGLNNAVFGPHMEHDEGPSN